MAKVSCDKYCDDTCNKKYPGVLDALGSGVNNLLDGLPAKIAMAAKLGIEILLVVIVIGLALKLLPVLKFLLTKLFPEHIHTDSMFHSNHADFKSAWRHTT